METDEDTVVDELIELLLPVTLLVPDEIVWQDSGGSKQEEREHSGGELGKFNILLVLAFDFGLVATVSVLLDGLVEQLSVMK